MKESAPSGSIFFPLREVPILKRGAIEENHCLFQESSFDVRILSAFWLRLLGWPSIKYCHKYSKAVGLLTYYVYRGSYMSAHVLLNLLNELGKRDKMRGLPSILSLFRNEFNKFNKTRARMLDSIYHMTNTLKSDFWRKNVIILSLCTQRCYGRHNVSRKSINH